MKVQSRQIRLYHHGKIIIDMESAVYDARKKITGMSSLDDAVYTMMPSEYMLILGSWREIELEEE